MSAAACKVPINSRLLGAISAFHKLQAMPGWLKLDQQRRDRYAQRAIGIDEPAIDAYDALNLTLANELDD